MGHPSSTARDQLSRRPTTQAICAPVHQTVDHGNAMRLMRAPHRAIEHIRGNWLTAQSVLGQYPRVFLPYARRRFGLDYDGMPIVVGGGTEAVIEGFPRS